MQRARYRAATTGYSSRSVASDVASSGLISGCRHLSSGKDEKKDPMQELLARLKSSSAANAANLPRTVSSGGTSAATLRVGSSRVGASSWPSPVAGGPAAARPQTAFVDPIRAALNKNPVPKTMLDTLMNDAKKPAVAPTRPLPLAATRPPIQNKFNTKPTNNIDKLTKASVLGGTKDGTGYDNAALKKRVMESFAVGKSAAAGRRPGSVMKEGGGSQRLADLSGGLPTDSNIQASDIPAEMTESEWLHERKREHLRRKREQFDKSRPPGPDVEAWVQGSGKALDVAAMKKMYNNRLESVSGAKPKTVASSADKDTAFRVFNQLPGARKKNDKNDVKETKVNLGTVVKEVVIPSGGLTVRELSSRLSMKVEVIRQELSKLGENVDGPEFRVIGGNRRRKRMRRVQGAEGTGDDTLIDPDVSELLVLELGFSVEREKAEREYAAGAKRAYSAAVSADAPAYPTRDPIVCVMGHVDHGKTTLMDRLRTANVAAGEAGGITQKLSAFAVNIGSSGRKAVFIDTPGHAAFGGMRSSGASATDVAVLVIALDDGVRPQTAEVIRLVKESKCTLMVALNKVDKIPASEREVLRLRVLNQLMELDVAVEEYGGEVVCTEISGKTGVGVDALLESILLQTDVLELNAPTEGLAEATVLDSRFEKGRGVVADCLVRWGQLEVGDVVVVGMTYGIVKSMTNDSGARLKQAGPSTAVQLLGLRSVPTSGQELLSVESEEEAKLIVERRIRVAALKKERRDGNKSSTEQDIGTHVHATVSGAGGEEKKIVVSAVDTVGVKGKVTAAEAAKKILDEQGAVVDEHAMAAAESIKKATLNVILKADGVGTLEALNRIADGLNTRTNDARIRIINSSVGAVVKSDIDFLSTAENGVIFGFNVTFADATVKNLAKHKKIEVVTDSVVYRLEDDMVARLSALMPVERRLVSQGSAKVLQLFPLNSKTRTVVAGLSVTKGILISGKDCVYTVKRSGKPVLEESPTGDATLRRFKDVVSSVASGLECGLSLACFSDFQEGDEIECYKVEHAVKVLKMHPDANSEHSGSGGAASYGWEFKKNEN